MQVASPAGYGPRAGELPEVRVTDDPREAVDGAHAVVTDVWASMGQEDEAAARKLAFEGYTVDDELMGHAAPDAVFLHCLPAHRGEEVAASVVDGPRSLVWPEAENRMHAQRGLLWWLLERV
jgi:ornithine carbamoyltransferase